MNMQTIQHGLIIAAGSGSRLACVGQIKPLVEVHGKPLIHHVVDALAGAGLSDFTFVLGCEADRVRPRVLAYIRALGLRGRVLINDQWQRANGVSVLRAEGELRDPFVLTMCDHLYPPDLVRGLLACGLPPYGLRLAVDRRLKENPLVDLEDVTRVRTEGERIVDIGKKIGAYNAFDTGVFLASSELFAALSTSIRGGDDSLSGGVRVLAAAGRAAVADIGDQPWLDVDDEAALAKAQALFFFGLTPDVGGD
jgi:1L-myo-inositol 1-phosphate cytidylyltransferase